MKKLNSLILLITTFFIAFCTSCASDDTGKDGSNQPLTVQETNGTLAETVNAGANGATVSLWLTSKSEWQAEIPEDAASWLKVEPAEGIATQQLRVKVTLSANDYEESQSATITFVSKSNPDLKQTITVNQQGAVLNTPPKADLLDLVFKNDGTAEDVSSKHFAVNAFPGATLMTYYNDAYKRYVAQFTNSLGASVTSGFYSTAVYNSDADFTAKLSDGFSMETLCRLDAENPATAEIKMIGSTTAGGTALMLLKNASAYTALKLPATTGSFTFLAHIGGGWKFPDSGVVPEVGKYYHLVGVWNKAEGKMYLYINGELKGSLAVSGDLKFPTNANALRFGVGVGSGSSATRGEAAWNGDIAIARIYSDPLTFDQVKDLWRAVRTKVAVEKISIGDLEFLPVCTVAPNYKYTIFGTGFKSGDVILLASTSSDNVKFTCETTITDKSATITIPSGITTDKYRLVVKRGNSVSPLGFVDMTVASAPSIIKPKVVAHRGYHNATIPENSITALSEAQKLKVYASECDAWITTDGVVVINHNPTVPGYTAVIQESAYDQIKDETLSNGEKLPTLTAYLDQCKTSTTTKLMIEIKSHTTADRNNQVTQAIVAAVKAKGLEANVEYIAFDYDVCKAFVAAFPNAVVAYLGGDKAPAAVVADKIKCIDYQNTVLNANMAWIKEAHDNKLLVNVWTIDTKAEMLKFIGAGADFISTNDPDLLNTLLAKTYLSAQ